MAIRTVNLLVKALVTGTVFQHEHYGTKYKAFILFVAMRINLFHVHRGCVII